jgi:hypothetical protein
LNNLFENLIECDDDEIDEYIENIMKMNYFIKKIEK